MGKAKFYVCKHCGNVAGLVVDKGVPLGCCGEKMSELVANTVDASREKHVPSVSKEAGKIVVKVGDIAHPMEEKHFIEFVYVEAKNSGQKKKLSPSDEPTATFTFVDDEPVAVYAYCNIHGLWVTQI